MGEEKEKTAFDKTMAFMAKWEGGFVGHPRDQGRRTNRGVTQRTYHACRAKQGLAQKDVLYIEDHEVSAVYRRHYWDRTKCSTLLNALDLIQLDMTAKFLQRALNCANDGLFGSITAAVARYVPATMKIYFDQRKQFYRGIVERKLDQATFLRAWLNRLNDLNMEAGVIKKKRSRFVDYGDAGYIARIPDLEECAPLERWV